MIDNIIHYPFGKGSESKELQRIRERVTSIVTESGDEDGLPQSVIDQRIYAVMRCVLEAAKSTPPQTAVTYPPGITQEEADSLMLQFQELYATAYLAGFQCVMLSFLGALPDICRIE